MKYDAWVAEAAKQPIVLETVDFGPLGVDEVEVAVEHCGLCHSDLSLLLDDWGISNPAHAWTCCSRACTVDAKCSARVSTHFTGRPSRIAARGTSTSSEW